MTDTPDLPKFWADFITGLEQQIVKLKIMIACVEREHPGLVGASYDRLINKIVREAEAEMAAEEAKKRAAN